MNAYEFMGLGDDAGLLTPRQRGLADMVHANVRAAQMLGYADLEASARALAQEVAGQTVSPITAPALSKRASDIGAAIAARDGGVNPLDVAYAGQFASDKVNAFASGNILTAGILQAGDAAKAVGDWHPIDDAKDALETMLVVGGVTLALYLYFTSKRKA